MGTTRMVAVAWMCTTILTCGMAGVTVTATATAALGGTAAAVEAAVARAMVAVAGLVWVCMVACMGRRGVGRVKQTTWGVHGTGRMVEVRMVKAGRLLRLSMVWSVWWNRMWRWRRRAVSHPIHSPTKSLPVVCRASHQACFSPPRAGACCGCCDALCRCTNGGCE